MTRRIWIWAALLYCLSYAAVQWLGAGLWRSEFLGASAALGVAGLVLWALTRWAARRQAVWPRAHGLSLFFLNWFFAACLMAALAW